MEMPEGWKRLKDYAEDHDVHNDDMGGCFMFCDGYAEALSLIKEMAEALEIVEETIGYEGGLPGYYPHLEEKYKLQFQNSDVSKKVIETLKKFKEWK